MKLIVGLGNPGLKYKNTRHNAGFTAIDALSQTTGIRFNKKRFSAETGEGSIGGEKVLLLKPLTYMNLSGNAIAEAAGFYKLSGKDLIVIYDDTDLALGRLRVRAQGSAGTHNGMRSIVSRLGTQEFARVRIGIGQRPGEMELADFVLAKLSKEEKQLFEKACEEAAEAVKTILCSGLNAAQERYNGETL